MRVSECACVPLCVRPQAAPCAHKGFLKRARAIDVEGLWEVAQQQRRRLVLCGHSLGAAGPQPPRSCVHASPTVWPRAPRPVMLLLRVRATCTCAGGAVAKLCALRLLRQLPDVRPDRLRCVAFATPAVGNAALAELVESAGWGSHFLTFFLPGECHAVRLRRLFWQSVCLAGTSLQKMQAVRVNRLRLSRLRCDCAQRTS